ncbi:zinc finger protein 891-like isoform X3 [Muntiacus reevesi]|uniref:zinc finger protein 891-like isoform X3 n=1 Tax=Muntiacus reevesi TaxID=9886 RepID=UPI003306A990
MGPAGPRSKNPVPRHDAGELQEPDFCGVSSLQAPPAHPGGAENPEEEISPRHLCRLLQDLNIIFAVSSTTTYQNSQLKTKETTAGRNKVWEKPFTGRKGAPAQPRRKSHEHSLCGKVIRRNPGLATRRNYTGAEREEREECGEAFGYPSFLWVHVSSHAGERTSKCSQCGKAFSCNSSLGPHA